MSLTTIVTCFEIFLLERLPNSDSPMNLNYNLYNPTLYEPLRYMKRLSLITKRSIMKIKFFDNGGDEVLRKNTKILIHVIQRKSDNQR